MGTTECETLSLKKIVALKLICLVLDEIAKLEWFKFEEVDKVAPVVEFVGNLVKEPRPPEETRNLFIVKILNLYIILLCTHLYQTSFQYLSITCNASIAFVVFIFKFRETFSK